MKRICVIEDDLEICKQLKDVLDSNGYESFFVTNFSDPVAEILDGGADMVLLDITLPGANGEHILRKLRKESNVPVIMVTSKNTEMDEVLCMSYGADDFIAKPYNPTILLLHMEAVFKRLAPSGDEVILSYQNLRLDIGRCCMTVNGQEAELTKNEMRILAYLIKHSGTIVARDELIGYLWDSEEFVDDNTLTVNVNRVRAKLKEHGLEDVIKTKRGIGYLLA